MPVEGFDFKDQTGTPFNYFAFGAACAEVEVCAVRAQQHLVVDD